MVWRTRNIVTTCSGTSPNALRCTPLQAPPRLRALRATAAANLGCAAPKAGHRQTSTTHAEVPATLSDKSLRPTPNASAKRPSNRKASEKGMLLRHSGETAWAADRGCLPYLLPRGREHRHNGAELGASFAPCARAMARLTESAPTASPRTPSAPVSARGPTSAEKQATNVRPSGYVLAVVLGRGSLHVGMGTMSGRAGLLRTWAGSIFAAVSYECWAAGCTNEICDSSCVYSWGAHRRVTEREGALFRQQNSNSRGREGNDCSRREGRGGIVSSAELFYFSSTFQARRGEVKIDQENRPRRADSDCIPSSIHEPGSRQQSEQSRTISAGACKGGGSGQSGNRKREP